MKAVGLVSGGKDSIFAMHCAREMGHSICALATLLPRGKALETDSYMYQSVGTAVTEVMAACMGVPHFTAEVRGQPILTDSLDYETTSGDEVEDLHDLLMQVTKSVPGVQAVTCGAILSEFQRRRLEHVCHRLGLVPICLMWNRHQETLLREMVNWGMQAVVVKTASMGLSRKQLGRSISELLPHFIALNRQHDFHVCGEGGEYETLTLDCPLFQKGSIVVSQWKEVCQNDDPVAPVCILSPVVWQVKEKEKSATTSGALPSPTDTKTVALSSLRFKTYEGLIRSFARQWNAECRSVSTAPLSKSDVRSHSEDAFRWSKKDKWNVQLNSSSTGCIRVAEVLARFEKRYEPGSPSAFPSATNESIEIAVELKDYVSPLVGNWLDSQQLEPCSAQQDVESAVPAETICQICHPCFISILKDIFASKGVPVHPITFVVTPLPHEVLFRLRMVLSYSSKKSKHPRFYLKAPTNAAVLHLHSLNLWISPCFAEELDKLQSPLGRNYCCTCQSVRCTWAQGTMTRVNQIFLRGCDGRLPFSGMLPEAFSSLSFDNESKDNSAAQEGADIALQVVSSFLNMQQTLRLMRAGCTHRGLSESDHEIDDEVSCIPYVLPSCILVFVDLDEVGKDMDALIGSDGKLEIVKELVDKIHAQWKVHNTSACGCSHREDQSIVVVAQVRNLPQRAKILALPLWEIALSTREDKDTLASHVFATEHVQQQTEEYEVTVARRVTVLQDAQHDRSSSVFSALLLISFQLTNRNGNRTLPSFLGQLSKTFCISVGELQAHKDLIARKSCVGAGENSIGAAMLEIIVFYCSSYVGSLGASEQAFEADCLEHIKAACFGTACVSSDGPIVTFFPVVALARGCVQVLVCSVD